MPDSPARPGRPPALHGPVVPPGLTRRPAVARSRPAPPRPVARRAPQVPAVIRPGPGTRAGAILVVVVLVAAALWLDRDRHDPVPPYGIVHEPGFTSITALGGVPEAGDPAPNFVLPATDGEVVELADARGDVVVLHFWTTWCLECRAEVPGLQTLSSQDGLTVLGIDVGESTSRAEAAVADLDVTYPVLVDTAGGVAEAYGVEEYPVTIVIDPDGVIATATYGPLPTVTLTEQVTAARD